MKKKNAEFLEVASAPKNKQKEKVEKKMDPKVEEEMVVLEKYVNMNRIESAVSKFPDEKNRGKLKKVIMQDILDDLKKDEYKLPDDETWKKTQV